jgi:hypothetical protein
MRAYVLNRFKDRFVGGLNRFKGDRKMSSIALFDTFAERTAHTTSPLAALKAGAREAVERIRFRRAIVKLSGVSPHLLRDMGFEPEAIYEAADGNWRRLDAALSRALVGLEPLA